MSLWARYSHTMNKTTKTSIWSVPYVILLLANFFQSTAAFMTMATLPLYATVLGASAAMVGVVSSSFALSSLLIRPIAGPAFDSFSRRRMLILSQVIITICMFLYGFVQSLEVLVVVRLFHGIGVGCSGPLAMSMLTEYLPKDKFASGVSIYTLAQSFAQVIGPAAGLTLIDLIGFTWSYILAALSVLIAIIGVIFLKEPSYQKLPYKLRFDRMFAPQVISKAIALMCISTSFACMGSYIVLYGLERGIENLGFYFIVYSFGLVITRPIYGNLADKYGTPRFVAVGVLFFLASYIALSVATGVSGFVIAAILGAFGFGCCAPLLQSFALASVSASHRGAASNTMFTGLDLGSLIGPVIGGFIVEGIYGQTGNMALAYSNLWLYMLIPALGTLILSIRWAFHK